MGESPMVAGNSMMFLRNRGVFHACKNGGAGKLAGGGTTGAGGSGGYLRAGATLIFGLTYFSPPSTQRMAISTVSLISCFVT